MKKYILTNFLIIMLMALSGCNGVEDKGQKEFQEKVEIEETEEVEAFVESVSDNFVEEEFEEYDIQLMAVGDNLIHMGVVNSGMLEDGSLNYNFLYENMLEFISEAEISIINQETPLAGNELGFSGYPTFNSPTQIGDAIVESGFNVVLQASNHTADKGISGIDNCIAYWKNQPEVLLAGVHEPGDNEIPVLKVDDFSFAVLNYTYGPNYESASSKLRDRLNILCYADEETDLIDFTRLNPQVLEDIKKAKEVADVVIVCPHWGTEYQTSASSYQEEFAMQMTEAGADLIIGTHPHVVQPVEIIKASNGNEALCYYSLGNYVSTQKKGLSMLEAMAWVNFHVSEEGIALSIEESGVLPMVCHYSAGPTRIENIYLLEEYSSEMAQQHGIISYGGITFEFEDLQKWSEEILGEWILLARDVLQ